MVKAAPLNQKNPAQHLADLRLLESKEELKHFFFNLQTGRPKSVKCIRVDGASDEDPSYMEVHDLPAQYIFLLVCCFEQECLHPTCQKGRPGVIPSWYEGGPLITHIPLPAADQNRPWGNLTCTTCEGFRAGRYNHKFIDVKDKNAIAICIPPPSIVLKNEFSKLKEYPPTQYFIADVAKKVRLTPEVVHFWLDHLHTVLLNRKRGAKKQLQQELD